MRICVRLFAVFVLAFAMGCGEDDSGNATGALEIIGTWEGELPGEMRPSAAVFGCPFEMPPETTLGGSIQADKATIVGTGLQPGKWCVLAFLDANRSDGVMPISGVDFVAYPPEGRQSFEVEILAGETARLEVVYALIADEAEDTETETQNEETPGVSDVWIRLTVTCDVCQTAAPLVFYGYEGETMGTMPLIFNKYPVDVSFPFSSIIKATGPLTPEALAAGRYIVSAYQDENGIGMSPDLGEPAATAQVVDLVSGQWNFVSLHLESGQK